MILVKEDVKPIAGPGITRALTLVLYVLTIGVFTGLWVFYSDKTQWDFESITQRNYSRDSESTIYPFKCAPLQGMDLHGLTRTLMTYDDCLGIVEPATATNVKLESGSAGAVEYVYEWTTGGVARYLSDRVLNPTWKKDGGYLCRPSKPDQKWKMEWNYDECANSVSDLTASNFEVLRWSESVDWQEDKGHVQIKYRPFANANKCFDIPFDCMLDSIPALKSKDKSPFTEISGSRIADCGTIDLIAERDAYSKPDDKGFCKNNNNDPCFAEILEVTNGEFSLMNEKCKSADEILCGHLKSAAEYGPFTCSKKTGDVNDALPTNIDEAVTYYKKNFAPDALCAPLKMNAPFTCTRSKPKSPVEILGLSLANTQFAFSIFGTLIVFLLYTCKKAKDPDFLQEDELLAKLEKLEAAIKRLEV